MRQVERAVTTLGYLMAFVSAIVVVAVGADAYLCHTKGEASGVMRAANINLSGTGDIDLTLGLSINAWFQSRLHTATVDAVNCAMHIDTPNGRRLQLSDASMVQSEPITLQPKPWWASLDGTRFEGFDAPQYDVEGTVALSRVNFASIGQLLVDALVEPWSGTHTLGADCTVDASVMLFGVPALAVSVKQHQLSAHREFNLTHPAAAATESSTSPASDVATNELQRRALDTVSDVAGRLKDFLSSIPALGPSLDRVPGADYQRFVDSVSSSFPGSILNYLLYPIVGANINGGESSKTYNMAKWDFGYDFNIPAEYIPDFLVDVQVPALALRMSSGTPGATYSWLLSSESFRLNLTDSISVPSSVSCGNMGKNCTLMTPVFGFTYNIVHNRRDRWMFDLVGADNFVYRALGRNNSVAYTLDVNLGNHAIGIDSDLSVCMNVTVSDRWKLQNACAKKPPGRAEVDLSFDIPSADGTPGTYLGMDSAFTWTYSTFIPPSISPTTAPSPTAFLPTAPPTNAPSAAPTAPSAVPSVAPTVAPSLALAVPGSPTYALLPPSETNSWNCKVWLNMDVKAGAAIATIPSVYNGHDCYVLCNNNPRCVAWGFSGDCNLYDTFYGVQDHTGMIAGTAGSFCTDMPTAAPTGINAPTLRPTLLPTASPTVPPTSAPTAPSAVPTSAPTVPPTVAPSVSPSRAPTYTSSNWTVVIETVSSHFFIVTFFLWFS